MRFAYLFNISFLCCFDVYLDEFPAKYMKYKAVVFNFILSKDFSLRSKL